MEQDNSRFIPLEGCINFRDLGGYSAGNGQTVKWRRLFRSDAVHSMTPQDTEFVYNTLGVVTLIDLRNTAEVQRDGGNGALPSWARYHHLPFLEEHGITPFSPSEVSGLHSPSCPIRIRHAFSISVARADTVPFLVPKCPQMVSEER